MTAQDVINLGKDIHTPNQSLHIPPFLLMVVLISWMAIMVATVFIKTKIDRSHPESILSKSIGGLGLVVGCASTAILIMGYLHVSNTYVDKTTEWKAETAYPYIKSQEYVDLELTSIEKAPYPSKDQPDEIIKYRNAEQIIEQLDSPERTRFDKTNGKKSYTLIYDVPSGETPFVRFYMLSEDLGHGMKPGPYGLDIHLNKK